MTNKKLDPQEKSIRDSYNRGEWQSIGNFSREAARYQEYAQSALRKDTRINIRISSEVLDGLKSKAMEEGLPYQTSYPVCCINMSPVGWLIVRNRRLINPECVATFKH
jgi:predicted DNA binding CopG/RHH family protein